MTNKRVASHGKRLLNYIIDYFFALLPLIIFSFIFVISGGSKEDLLKNENYLFIIRLTTFMTIFLYFFLMETLWGKTVGKIITHTKVVDESGKTPSMGRVFIRTMSRYIPFEAFTFLRSEPIGWHDSISKTRVVEK